MCYLPKATFYFYFAFFFIGYLWIFMIYFYNVLGGNQNVSQIKKSNPLPDSGFVQSDGHLPIYNLEAKPSVDSSMPCVDTRSEPSFKVCLHDPSIDKGISAHINLFKEWEPETVIKLKEVLQSNPNMVFLDIGANIGYYSLIVAALGHKVIAMEPFPDNLRCMHRAAHLNGLQKRITVVQAAVSDSRKILAFADEPSNVGGRFVISNDEMEFKFRARKQFQITSVLLDDLLQIDALRNQSVLLKLDIEGHECHALLGAEQLFIKNKVVAIIMEWEETRLLYPQEPKCVNDAFDFLTKMGYRPFSLSGQPLNKLDPSDLNLPQDIFWKKNT